MIDVCRIAKMCGIKSRYITKMLREEKKGG